MRSRVYVTVGCPSVRLSVCPGQATAACSQFAAESGRRLIDRCGAAYRLSIDIYPAGAPALSSKRGQRHVESRGTIVAQRSYVAYWLTKIFISPE